MRLPSLPSLSVVIPVYGRLSTLKDAVESVFLQDYKGFLEIIVVDDGSPSFVYQCLKPYLSRIKYHRLDVNSGVSASRNMGLQISQGEFISFLDSDDIFLPSKLTFQIESLLKHKLLVSHTNEFWYRGGKFINQGKKHSRYGGEIFPNILDMCRVSPSSLAVHKDVFDRVGFFDESLKVCEDYEWSLRCALKYSFDYVEKKLLIKRAVTDNSLSASIKYIESIRLDILENFEKKYGTTLSAENYTALKTELERKSRIVKR